MPAAIDWERSIKTDPASRERQMTAFQTLLNCKVIWADKFVLCKVPEREARWWRTVLPAMKIDPCQEAGWSNVELSWSEARELVQTLCGKSSESAQRAINFARGR